MPAPPSPSLDSEIGAIEAALEDVRRKIQEAAADLDEGVIREDLRSRMTAQAREFSRMSLGDGSILFDADFSTIELERGGRRTPLSILGGAEIHVMYHISAFLGLHHYLADRQSFVPQLLVLDQSSQPYFPSEDDDTDIGAVRSIYDRLFAFAEQVENKVQIIALDHADFSDVDERFRAAKGNRSWRGNVGLVPE